MRTVPIVRRAASGPASKLEAGAPEGVVRGYASVFNRRDLAGDSVEPGAFRASLLARGVSGIRMLWQHDPAEPVGVWTAMREDDRGLFVEGRLALDTARGRDVFALVRAGAVDGLSIGFRARRARREAGSGLRRLLEIDLWEVSIVTFPMQELARVREARHLPARLLERLAAGSRAMRRRPAVKA